MSKKHLKRGDPYPIIEANTGALHLLTMRFCPYAQRIHLVLDAKDIAYHTININLKDKPDWINKYSPLGKVPAIGLPDEIGHPYLYESLMVADYLDDKYPNYPLYPIADPLAKVNDRLLIARFDAIVNPFFRIVFHRQSDDESLDAILEHFTVFENELVSRGSAFFGGSRPTMVDFMIWPWCERITALKDIVEPAAAEKYAFNGDTFPKLVEWRHAMITVPAVQKSYLSEEIHAKYYRDRAANGIPNYDMLL